jgi:hypothetical protein
MAQVACADAGNPSHSRGVLGFDGVQRASEGRRRGRERAALLPRAADGRPRRWRRRSFRGPACGGRTPVRLYGGGQCVLPQ